MTEIRQNIKYTVWNEPNDKCIGEYKLSLLFDEYNKKFFDDRIPKLNISTDVKISKRISGCFIPAKNTIWINTILIKNSMNNAQSVEVCGLRADDIREVVQLILEHEMIHALIYHIYPNVDQTSHGPKFRDIAKQLGHKNCSHELGIDATNRDIQKSKMKTGNVVSFKYGKNNKIIQGVIKRVNKKTITVNCYNDESYRVPYNLIVDN